MGGPPQGWALCPALSAVGALVAATRCSSVYGVSCVVYTAEQASLSFEGCTRCHPLTPPLPASCALGHYGLVTKTTPPVDTLQLWRGAKKACITQPLCPPKKLPPGPKPRPYLKPTTMASVPHDAPDPTSLSDPRWKPLPFGKTPPPFSGTPPRTKTTQQKDLSISISPNTPYHALCHQQRNTLSRMIHFPVSTNPAGGWQNVISRIDRSPPW